MKRFAVWLLLLASMAFSPPAFAELEQISDTLTFQSAAGATGNGTSFGVDRYTTVLIQVVISATATVTYEGTFDGTNWVSRTCTSIASTSAALITSSTASDIVQCNVGGLAQFRVRVSAWTSGTVTATGRLTTALAKISSGGGSNGTASAVSSSTNLPGTCAVGDVYVDTDATSGQKLNYCDTTNTWVAVLTAETDTLQATFARGKSITGANSLANAFRWGDGSTPGCNYTDATLGPVSVPCTDADTKTLALTNFNWCLYDVEGASCIETVDPDAASAKAIWTYASAYRPRGTIWYPAAAMSVDGTQCATPTEATPLASGAKLYTIICTDNDSGRMYGNLVMPDSYDGGTLTFSLTVIQTAVNTSNLGWTVAAQCKGDTETLVTTANYGTEVTTTDAMTGSSAQNTSTSSAVTPAGTCAAGDFLAFYIDIDATITTTAMATTHIVGARIEYTKSSRSD